MKVIKHPAADLPCAYPCSFCLVKCSTQLKYNCDDTIMVWISTKQISFSFYFFFFPTRARYRRDEEDVAAYAGLCGSGKPQFSC